MLASIAMETFCEPHKLELVVTVRTHSPLSLDRRPDCAVGRIAIRNS